MCCRMSCSFFLRCECESVILGLDLVGRLRNRLLVLFGEALVEVVLGGSVGSSIVPALRAETKERKDGFCTGGQSTLAVGCAGC